MKWWPMVGLSKMLTVNEKYESNVKTKKIKVFKKSMNVFIIDAGNDNRLNFEIKALHTPKYNLHRFGIYFVASPKHADILMILGEPTKKMISPILETITQIPEPFGVIWIKGESMNPTLKDLTFPNLVSVMEGCPEPSEILSVILKVSARVD